MKRKPAIIRRRELPVATIPEKPILEFKRFFQEGWRWQISACQGR
jgi:hypothetical protein